MLHCSLFCSLRRQIVPLSSGSFQSYGCPSGWWDPRRHTRTPLMVVPWSCSTAPWSYLGRCWCCDGRKAFVLFAFFATLSICGVQLKLVLMLRPKYFAVFTEASGTPWMVYVGKIQGTCSWLVCCIEDLSRFSGISAISRFWKQEITGNRTPVLLPCKPRA